MNVHSSHPHLHYIVTYILKHCRYPNQKINPYAFILNIWFWSHPEINLMSNIIMPRWVWPIFLPNIDFTRIVSPVQSQFHSKIKLISVIISDIQFREVQQIRNKSFIRQVNVKQVWGDTFIISTSNIKTIFYFFRTTI